MARARVYRRITFWRRTAGVIALLAVAAQIDPQLTCAPESLASDFGCETAMDVGTHGESTQRGHSASIPEVNAPDTPAAPNGCGDDGMSGNCVLLCATIAVGAEPSAHFERVSHAPVADRAESRLIGIRVAPDSPPPKA